MLAILTRHTPPSAHYSGHPHTQTPRRREADCLKRTGEKGRQRLEPFFPWHFLDCISQDLQKILGIPEKLSLKKSTEIFHYFLKDQMCQWVGRNEGRVKSINRLLLLVKFHTHYIIFLEIATFKAIECTTQGKT